MELPSVMRQGTEKRTGPYGSVKTRAAFEASVPCFQPCCGSRRFYVMIPKMSTSYEHPMFSPRTGLRRMQERKT